MKFSKEWFCSEFANTSNISDNDLEVKLADLGFDFIKFQSHDDTVWEIAVPDHRPDCRSMIGIARQICAAFHLPFPKTTPAVYGKDGTSIFEQLDVDIWNDELCNRFTCRLAVNVAISTSPLWLQNRLLACGKTPVNNIMDIASYVTMEYGQPVEVLDSRCITSGSITIRGPFPGESFSDRKKPILCDGMNPIAVGRNLFDKNALIKDDATTVVIYAAHYADDPHDPMLTQPAVERMCQLIEQTNCGEIADGTIDILNYVPHPHLIPMESNNAIYSSIAGQKLRTLLNTLEIEIEDNELIIPSFRTDLKTFEDVENELRKFYPNAE